MTDFEKRMTQLLHSTDELRQLIIDNPGIPILIFAGEDCNCGNYSYMSCSYVNASLGEFLDCNQTVNDERCYCDRDEFEEALADSLYSEEYADMPDDEWDKLVAEKVAEYDPYWKKCIIVYVDN